MTQVQYLGYIIDECGVHVDPTKIQVIQDWPAPTNLTELRNFLGLANFYRRFMLGFSHITWPLSQVTKGGAKEKFFWSETQQKAFTELKHCLYCAPMLTLPDLQQPFEIQTDASDYAVGEVLTQLGHPVAYQNGTLSKNIPLMTKRCIPLYRLADNGSITFWGRKQSSTQTINPCISYKHKGSYRTITIRSGRHIYNSFI